MASGSTPAQVSLAWLHAPKPWIVPLPSATRSSHLPKNIGAEEVTFDPVGWEELNASVASFTVQGDRLPAMTMGVSGVEAPRA